MAEEKLEVYTEKVPLSAKTDEIIHIQPEDTVPRSQTQGLVSQGLALLSGLARLALSVVEARQSTLPSVQPTRQERNILPSPRAASPLNRQGRGGRRNRWRHRRGGR